tara:strand:- start:424 stop:624 length:201 start_codon:yes stop_codon:yes gene_type:complete
MKLDVVFRSSVVANVWIPQYVIDMNESVSFYEFQAFIEDYINGQYNFVDDYYFTAESIKKIKSCFD